MGGFKGKGFVPHSGIPCTATWQARKVEPSAAVADLGKASVAGVRCGWRRVGGRKDRGLCVGGVEDGVAGWLEGVAGGGLGWCVMYVAAKMEGDGVAVAGGAWERWGKRRCGWRRVAGGGWLESPYISPTEPQFPSRFHLLLHCGQPKPQTLNPRVVHMFFSIPPQP